ERTAGYAKDVQMVTYCSDGCQAGVVLLFTLKRLGFKNVQVLDGGLQAWEQKGFPISLPVAGKSV
ncbi:MAG: rhodanese-like domain-containing protein, partial [Candidatus Omnitrophota bacterium]